MFIRSFHARIGEPIREKIAHLIFPVFDRNRTGDPDQAHRMEGELAPRWHKSKRQETEKIQQKEGILVTQNKP